MVWPMVCGSMRASSSVKQWHCMRRSRSWEQRGKVAKMMFRYSESSSWSRICNDRNCDQFKDPVWRADQGMTSASSKGACSGVSENVKWSVSIPHSERPFKFGEDMASMVNGDVKDSI